MTALEALPATANGSTFTRGARVDYFIILTATLWATHRLPTQSVGNRLSSIQWLVVSIVSDDDNDDYERRSEYLRNPFLQQFKALGKPFLLSQHAQTPRRFI